MRFGTWSRLATMMVLVYAVQGAWFPLLAVHLEDLGVSGRGRGLIFATFALGALAAPLGAGRIADRYLSAQRLMALIYALSTGLLVLLASGVVVGVGPLFGLFLVYWLLVSPGLGLSSAIALRNLNRPGEQFGGVRLWGTVGWMVAGWLVSGVMVVTGSKVAGDGAYEAFWVASTFSVFLAVFAWRCLPDTPPLASKTVRPKRVEIAGALGLVRRPIVALYLITAFGVSITLPYMFQVLPPYLEASGMPRPWTVTAMTLGQVPEILALAALPWMLRRFGYAGTMTLGILAWVVRYGTLVIDPPLWLAVAGIPLHGIGIACFTIAGQMFLDSQAPGDRRAGAQGLNMVVTTGIGALIGNILAGEIVGRAGGDYTLVFLVPCLINVALLVVWTWGSRLTQVRSAAAPLDEPLARSRDGMQPNPSTSG